MASKLFPVVYTWLVYIELLLSNKLILFFYLRDLFGDEIKEGENDAPGLMETRWDCLW